jgi:hypothetical protein
LKQYESKFKAKSGLKWADRGEDPKSGKYAYVERSYEPDTEDEDEPVAVDRYVRGSSAEHIKGF